MKKYIVLLFMVVFVLTGCEALQVVEDATNTIDQANQAVDDVSKAVNDAGELADKTGKVLDDTVQEIGKTVDSAKEELTTDGTYDVLIDIPENEYPKTAAHIDEAIKSGESDVCTIDRGGADKNRELSLANTPTKDGYDRDEWPMAMCEEGGTGASVEYVEPSDNRGAGSWVGNQLNEYPDGTKVKFVVY